MMEQTGSAASAGSEPKIEVTLALSRLLASVGTSIVNIALPALAEAFKAPIGQVQATVVAYLVAMTIAAVFAGRLGDGYGLQRMLVTGLIVFAFASLSCAVAPNLWFLIGARAVQGVGAAFLVTMPMALMRRVASPARLGRAMGLLGTISALGTALGPLAGGLLLPTAGWRGIFWFLLPLAVLALFLTGKVRPRDAGTGPIPTQMRTIVNYRSLLPNLAVNTLVAAVMMATRVVGPFYLHLGLALEAWQIGLVMTTRPLISIVSGVPSGRLVDAFGSQRILTIGLILMAIGALLLAFLPEAVGVAGYVASLVVLTPGYQLFQAANTTSALADVPAERRGTVSGALTFSRNIGLIAGTAFMSAVFVSGVGSQDLATATAAAIAEGMRLTFLCAAGMMLLAWIMAFGSRRIAG